MDGLRKIQLYFDGVGFRSVTKSGSYDEIIDGLLSSTGSSPVSSFDLKAFNDKEISYEVMIDTMMYPTIEDYAKTLAASLKESLPERKFSYDIYTVGGKKPVKMDLIYFNVEYSYKYEDLKEDFEKAKSEYILQDYLIKQYNDAIDDGRTDDASRLKSEIESIQKIRVSQVQSPSELNLEKRAIESNTVPEEQPKRETSSSVITQPQPVIVKPSEKNTLVSNSEKQSDKAIIETISSSVFDTKIIDYERSKTENQRNEKETSQKISSVVPSVQPQATAISEKFISSSQNSLNDVLRELLPGQKLGTTQSLVPSDVSKVLTNIISREASNTNSSLEITDSSNKSLTSNREREVVMSSMNDALKSIQNSISSASSALRDAVIMMKSDYATSQRDSTKSANLSSISNQIISDMASDSLIKLEKRSNENSLISDIQSKITKIENQNPTTDAVNIVSTTIGNAVKNAVTSVIESNKTSSTGDVTNSKIVSPTSINTNNASEGRETNTNIGSQTLQSFGGSQPTFPSVVSLSQSTIDSLASAIIKNMSLTPFLNSGR